MLPEIASDLAAIRTHVGSMDPEMLGMHALVERIEGQMGNLNDRIGDLAERMADVERAVARLEPHVADVNLAVRPLRRACARMRPVQERTDPVEGVPEGGAEDHPGTDDGGRDPRL